MLGLYPKRELIAAAMALSNIEFGLVVDCLKQEVWLLAFAAASVHLDLSASSNVFRVSDHAPVHAQRHDKAMCRIVLTRSLTDGEVTVSFSQWIHHETDNPPIEALISVCGPQLNFHRVWFPSVLSGQVSGG